MLLHQSDLGLDCWREWLHAATAERWLGVENAQAGEVAIGGGEMAQLTITLAGTAFDARLETGKAPQTCAAFFQHLPFSGKAIHVRWSGEAVWMPLGDMQFGVGYENATSYPAPGEVILYPGGVSETEILLAYGRVNFASMAGQLAGNHFMTITSNLDAIHGLGRKVLWEGAQDISFALTGA